MEKIPDEILEEIFSYLDLPSLKSAVEVSERWSSVIKSSNRIGKSFAIIVNNTKKSRSTEIPIQGLKYGGITFKGLFYSNIRDRDSFKTSEIQKHQGTITKATFDHVMYSGCKLRISHGPMKIFKDFSNLKRLEIEDRFFTVHKFTWFGKGLTHLKIYKREALLSEDEFYENFYSKALAPQPETIQELKLRGFKQHDSMPTIIRNSKHLRVLELSLDILNDELQATIKDHKEWKELILKNIKANHEEIVDKILANHQRIATLTLEYEKLMEDCLIPEIPNLLKIQLNFTCDMRRSFDDLNNVALLEIRRLDNNSQMQKFLEFLNQCANLKVLKLNLISSRVNLTPRVMESILNAVNNLEELHLDAYSDRFDITHEALDTVKLKGENLKKFTMVVDVKKAEEMREKMKIFNDTEVRAIVMGKIIVPTCLEIKQKEYMLNSSAACMWTI